MSKPSKHASGYRSGPYRTDEQKAAQLIVRAGRFVNDRDLLREMMKIVLELIGSDEER